MEQIGDMKKTLSLTVIVLSVVTCSLLSSCNLDTASPESISAKAYQAIFQNDQVAFNSTLEGSAFEKYGKPEAFQTLRLKFQNLDHLPRILVSEPTSVPSQEPGLDFDRYYPVTVQGRWVGNSANPWLSLLKSVVHCKVRYSESEPKHPGQPNDPRFKTSAEECRIQVIEEGVSEE